MKLGGFVLGAMMFVLALMAAGTAHAQVSGGQDFSAAPLAAMPNPGAKLDGLLMKIIADKKNGAFFLGVAAGHCDRARAVIARMEGGAPKVVATFRLYPFPTKVYASMETLAPGDYVIAQAGCFNGMYSTAANFGRTPQAKFHVRAGELTNLGVLKLEFKGGNLLVPPTSLHRAVQPMNPQVAAHLKSRIPQSFPRLVNRPMTLIGPAEVSASSL